MTDEECNAAMVKARENLLKIARATGATIAENFCRADIVIGEDAYIIVPGHIYKMRPGAAYANEDTCLTHNETMPPEEYVAATLLLLKRDPTIFKRWCRRDAYYA